jgi:hypothetical protein
MTKFTPDIKESFLSDYRSGKRISELCGKYSVSFGAVMKWFKKDGIKTMGYVKEAPHEMKIVELHSKGYTTPQICKELNVTYSVVTNTFFRHGLKANRYQVPRRSALYEDYFESITSAKCAYFLGLLAADGCVMPDWDKVSISLRQPDSYLLEELKRELKSDAKIGTYKPKLSETLACSIQLHSKKMVSDLINHGLTARKSLTLEFPDIPSEYFWSFIRGFFDGNGCVSFQKRLKVADTKRVTFSASTIFNLKLKEIFEKSFGVKSCLSICDKTPEHSDLIIIRKEDIVKIRDLMYKDDCISMKRKKDRFFMDKKEAA